MKVRIDYSDGQYSMRPYTEEHAKLGWAGAEISEQEWRLWNAFIEQDRAWQQYLCSLDNQQYEQDHPERSDPDNPPLSQADLRRMKPVPRVKTIRRALSLTQEQFAERFSIPLGTLRDWEQGRSEPDQPARAYLEAIARSQASTTKCSIIPV